MLDMELDRVIAAAGGTVLSGDIEKYGKMHIRGICYDSRNAGGGTVFVPIAGEKVDAHRFIPQVFETECFASFTEHTDISAYTDKVLIKVDAAVGAAQSLAREYRKSIAVPVIGITGSVGKTTTRQMISLALSAGKKVYATPGNKNSQIGTPETILNFDEDADICVFEMGMSNQGEMTRLAAMVRPDAAVFTNIGVTHIEQLGSREAILEEKLHITDFMTPGSPVFINGDNDMLKGVKLPSGLEKITYGLDDSFDVYAEDIDESSGYPEFTAVVNGRKTPVKLSIYGKYQIYNALAGLAVADFFGVDIQQAARKLSEYKGFQHRHQIFGNGRITVIDDTYNAAPDSMRGALDILSGIKCAGRRIAVLADMKELGDMAAEAHYDIGVYASGKGNIDILITYGSLSENMNRGFAQGDQYHACTQEELEKLLRSVISPGDVILFKGSNSMGLFNYIDKVLDYEFM